MSVLRLLDFSLCFNLTYFYRPRSEASEGYVFIGVCHSVIFRGEGGKVDNTKDQPPTPTRVKGHSTSPLARVKGHNAYPPDQCQRSQHPPSPSQGQRSQHPPARVKGNSTSPWPGSKVTTPPLWPGSKVTTPPSQHYAQVGGTHPTGMHSCSSLVLVLLYVNLRLFMFCY